MSDCIDHDNNRGKIYGSSQLQKESLSTAGIYLSEDRKYQVLHHPALILWLKERHVHWAIRSTKGIRTKHIQQ